MTEIWKFEKVLIKKKAYFTYKILTIFLKNFPKLIKIRILQDLIKSPKSRKSQVCFFFKNVHEQSPLATPLFGQWLHPQSSHFHFGAMPKVG